MTGLHQMALLVVLATHVAGAADLPTECSERLDARAEGLRPTGWNSAAGTYGLLQIDVVTETEDASGQKFYVFEKKDGSKRVFALSNREFVKTADYLRAYGDGGGMGFRSVYRLRLRDVTSPNVSPEIVVNVEAENEGFRFERWTFALDGREQYLLFYDREAERRHLKEKAERNAARERHYAENPDPGSKAGIRKAIVDGLLAEGLKPSENYWIDEEVERQWAQMWHDLTR